jgi:hypothetical protein
MTDQDTGIINGGKLMTDQDYMKIKDILYKIID